MGSGGKRNYLVGATKENEHNPTCLWYNELMCNIVVYCTSSGTTFVGDHHLSKGTLFAETGPKQKLRFICSVLRPVLAAATDDFERIIKAWAKCCPGIFYMRWKRDGMGKRPAILITAGITAPWASLSVQQCNHQPSTCNARAAAASPGEGRGGAGEG